MTRCAGSEVPQVPRAHVQHGDHDRGLHPHYLPGPRAAHAARLHATGKDNSPLKSANAIQCSPLRPSGRRIGVAAEIEKKSTRYGAPGIPGLYQIDVTGSLQDGTSWASKALNPKYSPYGGPTCERRC